MPVVVPVVVALLPLLRVVLPAVPASWVVVACRGFDEVALDMQLLQLLVKDLLAVVVVAVVLVVIALLVVLWLPVVVPVDMLVRLWQVPAFLVVEQRSFAHVARLGWVQKVRRNVDKG